MEHALENQCLRIRVKNLEQMIEWHESNACELNKERIGYKECFEREMELFFKACEMNQENKEKRIEAEQELAKTKGELDKMKNTYRMLTGEEIE